MSKKSSVDWLINELHRKMNGGDSKFSYSQMFDKAREMHREEIEEAFKDSRKYDMKNLFKHDNAIDYYNNTFK